MLDFYLWSDEANFEPALKTLNLNSVSVHIVFTGAGLVHLKAERSLESVKSCVKKNKGECVDNIYKWWVYDTFF